MDQTLMLVLIDELMEEALKVEENLIMFHTIN